MNKFAKHIKDKMKTISQDGCALCGEKAYIQGLWEMNAHAKWIAGMPNNRSRIVIYNLCKKHSSNKDEAIELIENKLFSDCLMNRYVPMCTYNEKAN